MEFNINECIKTKVDQILKKSDNEKEIDTIVLSGGSMKGMAHIGVLHYLEKCNKLKYINTYAGTSAGAVICACCVIGYKPIELYHFFINLKLDKAHDLNPYLFLKKLGLDDGKKFLLVILKLFEGKSIDPKITFKSLYMKTKKNLHVTGTCINNKKCYYFSHITEPNMSVIDAIRISVSLPIYFTPKKYNGLIFVDGGCIDNYPINMFKHKLECVVGVYISEIKEKENDITSIESFFKNLFDAIYEGIDQDHIRNFENRTIHIKCDSSIKSNLSSMFDIGYSEATKFFNFNE